MRISSIFLLLLLLFLSSTDSIQGQPPVPFHTRIKALLTNVQSYLFPPNLEGSVANNEPTVNSASETEGGASEKVKDAVAKSLGEGMATVEESAKTAAQMLKDTLSSHHEPEEDL